VTRTDLIFNTADPVFAVDRGLRIALWNKAAEGLFGYRAEEALGRHCYDLIGCRCESGQLACHGNCLELLKSGHQELAPTHELMLRTKYGREVWVSVSTILMPSTRKDLSVLVHLFRDVTRQKQMEHFIGHLLSHAARLSVPAASDPPASQPSASGPLAITGREGEILRLLASGISTKAIAEKLCISPATARNHIHNILTKLEVHSRLEAVTVAMKHGLV
jgi:PAS domain S-box-containing protein